MFHSHTDWPSLGCKTRHVRSDNEFPPQVRIYRYLCIHSSGGAGCRWSAKMHVQPGLNSQGDKWQWQHPRRQTSQDLWPQAKPKHKEKSAIKDEYFTSKKLKYDRADFTLTMALYFSFSCWYMTLYLSTGSRDKVLLNSLLLHSVAQRLSLGSRSVESQASFGYTTPSENHISGVNTCSSKALRMKSALACFCVR